MFFFVFFFFFIIIFFFFALSVRQVTLFSPINWFPESLCTGCLSYIARVIYYKRIAQVLSLPLLLMLVQLALFRRPLPYGPPLRLWRVSQRTKGPLLCKHPLSFPLLLQGPRVITLPLFFLLLCLPPLHKLSNLRTAKKEKRVITLTKSLYWARILTTLMVSVQQRKRFYFSVILCYALHAATHAVFHFLHVAMNAPRHADRTRPARRNKTKKENNRLILRDSVVHSAFC